MIDRNQISTDYPVTTATIKINSLHTQEQIIDMLVDFTNVSPAINLESFVVKTVSVSRYNSRVRLSEDNPYGEPIRKVRR
jgi:hypothetical protein